MMSAFLMVESRCAMAMVVRLFMRRSSASCTRCSLSVASADVASSRMSMGGFLRMARAMLTRWRCPPESRPPRSPMMVLYPFSVSMMKSCALAIFAASMTCSMVAFSTPKVMLL